jgi:hypothetical protein
MKHGLKACDSDMHVYDHPDLYSKYMNPKWGAVNPNALEIDMSMLFLDVFSKYAAGFFVNTSYRAYPVAFAIGMIATTGALYSAKVFGD